MRGWKNGPWRSKLVGVGGLSLRLNELLRVRTTLDIRTYLTGTQIARRYGLLGIKIMNGKTRQWPFVISHKEWHLTTW